MSDRSSNVDLRIRLLRQRRLLAACFFLLLVVGFDLSGQGGKAPQQSDEDFLRRHWQTPIPLQGNPPEGFSLLEASLDPQMCAACHQAQYEDWRTTIHARSTGPGVLGQTQAMVRRDATSAEMCNSCHAPLSEQQEKLRSASSSDRFVKNLHFDAKLQSQGLTCAGCHVRGDRRFGPPKRDGSLENSLPPDQAPHAGATRTAAFERAEFCLGCHQFEEGQPTLNGKLLENTYNEWRSSPYAAQGIQCQHCHMPDRRHLWRGIHDPEMVKRGVSVQLQLEKPQYQVGEILLAKLVLSNTGVGHFFPSYVTAKVVLQIQLIDEKGNPIEDTLQQEAINREATLDLSEEIYDTRIPPKGAHMFTYLQRVTQKGLRLKATVVVYPDEFYRKFYEAKLTDPLSPTEKKKLGQALENTKRSAYTLFEKEVPIS
ncbi:MAG: hypothetical protein HY314_02890 [Acidobacteria bacterium]|nr:hypothetical protein [Acidobacteriota bacterium]